jgi:capsular polysaccharide transport system ATP-binding protein
MIEVIRVSKEYPTRNGVIKVLKDLNFTIHQGERLGILGKNGAGKSTLIRILAGAERATSGSIKRAMSISWPLAFGGTFQGSLSGIDNIKFIARIYFQDYSKILAFVTDFSELGAYLREPVKTYSSGMTARLAFALTLAMDFDCLLIDEVLAVGDIDFQLKCQHELFVNRADKAFVMVSHSKEMIKQYCNSAALLNQGSYIPTSDIDSAYAKYESN